MPFVHPDEHHKLHLCHWAGGANEPVVLMVHGAIENGRIFHSRSGKGLAPWLATQGFDVNVLDLRGRGGSRPVIGPDSDHGQWESIVEDIPAVSDYLYEHREGAPQHWVAHSWGGVLMAATLARRPEYRERVASLTFFGSKRCVRVWNPTRFLYVTVVWHGLCHLLSRRYGYVPARQWKIGSDNESRLSHAEGAAWVKPGPWIDPRDGFDYGAALEGVALPPILSFAGANDPALGHPRDAKDFLDECGTGEMVFHVMSRANGFHRDYGHLDMLTAPEAREDHFPMVGDWIRENTPR